MSRKRYKTWGKFTHGKRIGLQAFDSTRLLLKLVTLNDLKRRNGRYFASFHQLRYLWANYVKWLKLGPYTFCNINVAPKNLVFGNMTYSDIFIDYRERVRYIEVHPQWRRKFDLCNIAPIMCGDLNNSCTLVKILPPLLERAISAFIRSDLWPANSPDLSPIDYIWPSMDGAASKRVRQWRVHNSDNGDQLKYSACSCLAWHGPHQH